MQVPPAPCNLIHSFDLQARFSDYDAFQHVNNNAYLQYFDLGKVLFLQDMSGHEFEPADLSAVIVNISLNFYHPTRIGEAVSVRSGVKHLGDRAFTIYQQVVSTHNGEVKVTAETVLAGFDIRTQAGAPLQPWLRECLERALATPAKY